MSRQSNVIRILLPLGLLLVLAKFTFRGPVLSWSLSQDFKTFYAASRAWSRGTNPYDHKVLNAILEDGGAAGGGHTWDEEPSIYPPTTYASLSPIAQLPWRPAKLAWCLINIASLTLLLSCLCQLMGFRLFELRTFLLVAGVLALQPVSATLRVGQLSLIVAALGTAALVLSTYGRESASGFLVAFAFGLKPQLALAFLVRDVFSRRWRACFAASITLLAILLIALLRLHTQSAWFRLWLIHLRAAFDTTGVNSLDPSSPHHRNLLNLQYPIRLILKSDVALNAVALAIGAILVLPALRTLTQAKVSAPALLQSVSLLVVVQLLTMYHRDYDAALLALPLAWALSPQVPLRHAMPTILLIAVFFFPFLHILYMLDQSPFHSLLSTGLSQLIVWPYQTWTLLGLAGWLSYCCAQRDFRLSPQMQRIPQMTTA